jgi:hypothetical protein
MTILGGDLLGKLLSALGQIALAVMGIKALFPGLAATIAGAGGGIMGVFKSIGAAIAGMGAPILLIAGIITAVIVGMYLAWKENFLGMKQTVQNFIDGVKQWFNGLITFFSGIWDIIKGIFSGNGDLIIQGLKKMFQGLFDWFVGGIKSSFNLVVGIIIGAVRIVVGVVQGIFNAFIAAYDTVSKLLGGRGTSFRINWLDQLSVPSFKEGGIMPYTGMAYLHAGEKIIPTSQLSSTEKNITFSPTIYIDAEVSSDMDVRNLADKLSYYWAKDFEKMTQGRVT